MALLLSFWLLLVVIAHCSILSTNANKAFVRPSENISCSSQPCLTLNEYAREADQYFVDNTTFMFLPGIHQLDIQLNLVSVSDIVLLSSNEVQNDTPQIQLSPLVKITWTNCENIEIRDLVFVLSGQSDNQTLFSAQVFIKTTSFLSQLTLVGNDTLQSTAIYIESSRVQINDVTVMGALSTTGPALIANRSTIVFLGQNAFFNNTAINNGGALLLVECECNFTGNVSFINNTVSDAVMLVSGNVVQGGGAIYCTDSVMSFTGSALFHHNRVASRNKLAGYGGAIASSSCTLTFGSVSNVSFSENTANLIGGAMLLSDSNLTIDGRARFGSNVAGLAGGALGVLSLFSESWMYCSGRSIVFQNNRLSSMSLGNETGGAMYVMRSPLSQAISIVELEGILFEGNTAAIGGAISFGGSYMHISTSQFVNNTAYTSGGAVGMDYNSALFGFLTESDGTFTSVNFSGDNYFVNNGAPLGGAIYARDSSVNLTNTPNFFRNSAQRGGAMALSGNSKLILNDYLIADFTENQATMLGGAIFFTDTISFGQCSKSNQAVIRCFVELPRFTRNVQLIFVNNTADIAGTVLYGGSLDRCMRYNYPYYTGRDSCGNIQIESPDSIIDEILKISTIVSGDNVTSDISSDPFQVCLCMNNSLNCSDQEIETIRGKEFTLQAVTVGQNNGTIPSSVRIALNNTIEINATQRIQNTDKVCTTLTYRLSTDNDTTTVILFPGDGPCRDTGCSGREIRVKFLPCPDGFMLDGLRCTCDERLLPFTTNCSIDDASIKRSSNTFWIGTVYNNGSYEGLILHSGSCPLDYCVDTPVSIQLDSIDIQCNHNHSGILCGSCKDNYSIAFGTLHCLPCSNNYLALILPFALAGIALVAIILLLKLSISFGTMNGLIFYANVIQANRSAFFPSGETNILTVFIAWLNLDLGIETCFYDGMTTYAFTWLQFLFPFYVWFLIGLIIVVSRYSSKIARSLGNNPVATLATLFLLSYSKILRAVIIAISVTRLEYPGGIHRMVWPYDGSMPYVGRADRNVLVAFAELILITLFLPYTLLLFFGHWLQIYSHWWILSWLNKIKPFMDAYHAPFKKGTRYWTGLLLLVRLFLFVFDAINSDLNLIVITSVTAVLAALAWIHKGIYDNLFNDILEAFFIVNLCIFASSTYQVSEGGGSQARLAYFFVGIAFATSICIVLYHIYLTLHKTSVWKKIMYRLGRNKENRNEEDRQYDDNEQSLPVQVPTSVVELREPLLEK